MSKQTEERISQVTCPKCGIRFEAYTWDAIVGNVKLSLCDDCDSVWSKRRR